MIDILQAILKQYKVKNLYWKECRIHLDSTACGVMFATRPCLPGTLFYTFVLGKQPIFSFIISTNLSFLTFFYTIQSIHWHINVPFWMKWCARRTWAGGEHHSTTSILERHVCNHLTEKWQYIYQLYMLKICYLWAFRFCKWNELFFNSKHQQ